MNRLLILLFALLPLLAIAVTEPANGGAQPKTVNGTSDEVQAAINNTPDGGVVEIRDGTYTWTSAVTINKAIVLRGQSKGGVHITTRNSTVDNIDASEPNDGYVEIANIDFDFEAAPNVWPVPIRITPRNPRTGGRCLLHDCTFACTSYAVRWETNGGVIWNCTFDHSKSGYSGISFVCSALNSDWSRPSTLGILDTDGKSNTYIEDCTATPGYNSAGIGNLDDNSRTVWRHVTWDNSAIGSHGQETSPEGTRQWEFYDNRWICAGDNKWNMDFFMSIRGGTGVICDNTFDDIPWGKAEIKLQVFSIRRRGQIPCQVTYPAARQIGQGWIGTGGYDYPSVPRNGGGYTTDPIYIWGNTNAQVQLAEYEPDECGNNQHIVDYVHLGRDYFEGTAKPGYQKYPYPHWMRTMAGGGNPHPTPTPAPTVTPQPTPTPPPLPTPTPPPSGEKTYRNWLDQLGQWIQQHPASPDQPSSQNEPR